jgi:glycosyltransferase involved in cell wall biosynthesis
MNNPRILHLRKSEGFYGAERVILALSEGAGDNDSASWIGCLNDSRNPCTALYDEAVRRKLPAVLFPCSHPFDPFCLRRIILAAISLRINLIHTHGFKADFYGYCAAHRLGIPVVSTQHGWTSSNRRIRLYEQLDLLMLRRFIKVVGVSQEIGAVLIREGVSKKRITVISNGISVPPAGEKSGEFLKSLGASTASPIVGIVGRLSVEKGHRDFLSAAEKVHRVRPAVRFWIVGSGTLRDELADYAESLGMTGAVRFLDFRSDMDRIFSHLDIIVSASLREGIPIALLEAMALARPVIATRVGGIPTFIRDGMNGILVPPQNPKILADRIIDLLDHPSKRKMLGARARRTVTEHYSSTLMNDDYYRLYRELV